MDHIYRIISLKFTRIGDPHFYLNKCNKDSLITFGLETRDRCTTNVTVTNLLEAQKNMMMIILFLLMTP